MPKCERVAELQELSARVLGCFGGPHAMIQMDLNFAPPGGAMVRKAIEERLVVLFSGIEISVRKRPAFSVAPFRHSSRVSSTPAFQTALLLGIRRASVSIPGDNGRLEVIGESNNQMDRTAIRPT